MILKERRSYTISKLDILKVSILLLIFYNFWFIRIIGECSIIHWILLLNSIVTALFIMGIEGVIYIKNHIMMFFWLFSIGTAFTGIIVASNYSNLFKAIIDNFEYAIIMGMIVWISRKEKSATWVLNGFILINLMCAITSLTQNITYNGRLILGVTGNSNDLGIKMVFGIFCILILLVQSDSLYKKTALICSLLLMINVVIMTSSRKSMITLSFLIIFFVILILPKILVKRFKIYSIFVFALLIILVIIAISKYLPTFRATKMFHRFTYTSNGAEDRLKLLSEAFIIFKKNPIFGIGLNNYRNISISGTYSHSTIGETLACTGIFGFFLWILFIYEYMRKLFYLLKNWRKINREKILMCIGGFITILFFSLGVILYYDFSSMICLSIIAAIFAVEIDSCRRHKKVNRRIKWT